MKGGSISAAGPSWRCSNEAQPMRPYSTSGLHEFQHGNVFLRQHGTHQTLGSDPSWGERNQLLRVSEWLEGKGWPT